MKPGMVACLCAALASSGCGDDRFAGLAERNRLASLLAFSEGFAAVQVAGKIGYIDRAGHLAFGTTFDTATPFHGGRAEVRQGDHVYDIDVHGVALPFVASPRPADASWQARVVAANPTFDADRLRVGQPSEGLASVMLLRETSDHLVYSVVGYADIKGKVTIPMTFAEGRDFHEGLAAAQEDNPEHDNHGLYGYIDRHGAWVIRPAFAGAEPFHKGAAWVSPSHITAKGLGGPMQLIDRTGKQIATEVYDAVGEPSADGLTAVLRGSAWGYVNGQGRLVIPCQFSDAKAFSEGRAAVALDEHHYAYIDTTGAQIFTGSFNTPLPEPIETATP